jgi:LptD protein
VNFSLKAKLFGCLLFATKALGHMSAQKKWGLDFNLRETLCPSALVAKGSVFFFLFILGLFCATFSHAQIERPIREPGRLPIQRDTLAPKPDLTDDNLAPSDTSSVKKDSVNTAKKGDIETTILYSATDSINFSIDRKIVKLYGDGHVKYGSIELDAELITIDYESSTITANGKPDSLGRLVGFPIFKDGNDEYETKGMVYNFKNKKAKITEVVTKQGEGFVAGAEVFKNEKNELFTRNNTYTTCDLKDPHFRIISKKAKAIPGDKIVTGPFYMEFNHVPIPLGFAFGMFPSQRKAQSGIIIPEYGEEQKRGFFMRNIGYFFDISDYIKVTVLADLYSKGSNALKINTNYNNRYKYSGSFNFSYTNNRFTDKIEEQGGTKDFSLSWSHSPRSRGSSRFSASVQAATSTFTRNNFIGGISGASAQQFNNASRKLTSNVSYSKTFPGTPFSLGINLRHSQDIATGVVDLPMPDVSFNVNNLYPFKNKRLGEALENLNIRYSMTGTNQITNNIGRIGNSTKDSIASFNFQNLPLFLENAKNGIKHSIPLSTTIKVLKYFALSPSINFDQTFYFKKLLWEADATEKIAVSKTVNTFNSFLNYSFSVGMNTRIYGTYLSKNPTSKIKGIRHIITPSVSYSYTPDFTDQYYQTVYLKDARGVSQPVLKSIHEGFVYGSSRQGESNSLGLSFGNTVELKVRSKKDTVDRKISLFNNLSISTGYNFLAKEYKLSPISISANTNVLNNKINININGTLDPYYYEKGWNDLTVPVEGRSIIERKIDRYAWDAGQGLGRITSAGLAFSTNLSPKGQKKDTENRDKIAKSNATQADKNYLLQNPNTYIDFKIPWNFRVSYNINYNRGLYDSSTPSTTQITQAMNFSGDLSMTEKWKITFSSGYDFVKSEITQSNFGISRDIHCWQMSLNWVPFGAFQSYLFNIGVKSTLLRDLKLNRTRNFFDAR